MYLDEIKEYLGINFDRDIPHDFKIDLKTFDFRVPDDPHQYLTITTISKYHRVCTFKYSHRFELDEITGKTTYNRVLVMHKLGKLIKEWELDDTDKL